MDKVQFNTEVVNTRKLVKRVKVQIVHSLTRQVARLRKKKGSEQQVLKNQRRATRFVAEIEAIKNLPADLVTKKAVTCKMGLQEVLNNPKSSAQDRVLARVIYHRLLQERFIKFKGMVTKDLLRPGTKKYRRLCQHKFELEADARLEVEEGYQATLKKMITVDQDDDDDGGDGGDGGDGDGGDGDGDSKVDGDVDEDNADEDDDEDSIADEDQSHDTDSDNGDENIDSGKEDSQRYLSDSRHKLHEKLFEPSEAHSEARLNTSDEDTNQVSEEAIVPAISPMNKSDVLQMRGRGKTKMDSMFLGSLSTMQDDDITAMLLSSKGQAEGHHPLHKQQPKAQQRTKEPTKKVVRKVPMVDQPNPVRQTPREKLIPGINCHPELPPRHTGKDVHKKMSRKPFPGRPESRQLLTRQSANQSRWKTVHPTAATNSPLKKPATKEIFHPSWEASKKQKEAFKIVPFQGKKITFDD